MKKFQFILAVLVTLSLLLTACGGGLTEPKADQPVTDPFMVWPEVCNFATGQCYQKVTVEKPSEPGTMPGLRYVTELIPITRSADDIAREQADLSALGIDQKDKVVLVMLPSSFWDEESGLLVSGAMLTTNPNPNLCKALVGHLIFRVLEDGVTWVALTAMLQAFSNGEITPTVVKSGANGAMAVQFVHNGIKWLILFGDSTMPPTVIGPVLGNTLGRLAGSLNNLVVGQGKGVGVMAEAVALVKCVKDNWPKDRKDAEDVKKKHNQTYSAKHLDQVPDSMPVPFPNEEGTPENAPILVMVQAGDFSKMETAALHTMIVLGIVVLAVDCIPGDEAVATAAYLQWSMQLAPY